MYNETGMSLSPPGKFSPNKHTHWDSRLIELRPSPAPRILKLIKSVLSGDYAKPRFFWDRRVDKRWKTSKRWKRTTRSSVQSKKQAAGGRWGVAGCDGLEQDGATMLSGQIATPDSLYQCDSCLPPTLTQPVAGGHWSLQTCLPEVYFSR